MFPLAICGFFAALNFPVKGGIAKFYEDDLQLLGGYAAVAALEINAS